MSDESATTDQRQGLAMLTAQKMVELAPCKECFSTSAQLYALLQVPSPVIYTADWMIIVPATIEALTQQVQALYSLSVQ
jgi:hypothetical protein